MTDTINDNYDFENQLLAQSEVVVDVDGIGVTVVVILKSWGLSMLQSAD